MEADGNDMVCRELVKVITDYLEGTLPNPERELFEAHLRVCEGCRRYVHQMRSTIRITGTLSEDGIEPAARDDLLRLFRDWNRA